MRFLCFLGLVVLCSTFSAASAQTKKAPPDTKAKFPADLGKAVEVKGKAVDLKGKALQEKFEELLPAMGAEDVDTRNRPQQEWQAICFHAGAKGNEEQRLEACKLMIAKLDPKTPNVARLWLLKQLEFLGRGESVDSVAALVQEKDALIHDAAVRCLAHNPAPEATAKLIAALPGAAGKARIGLVNALGYRADKSAVAALAEELKQKDNGTAQAAAKALGKIATPEATEVLAKSFKAKDLKDDRRFWIADAYLLCADSLLREGKTAQAKEIYTRLSQSKEEARSIHLAAFRGLLNAAGDEAGPLILEALNGNDADRKSVATIQIGSASPAALKHLEANIEKLPSASQAVLQGVLAARKDQSKDKSTPPK